MNPSPSSRTPRVLWITDAFPYPLTSGYLRQYHFMRLLSTAFDITLLSLVGGDHLPAHADAMRPFAPAIETFASTQRSRRTARKALVRLRAVVRPDGAAMRLAHRARALHAQEPFDLLFLAGKRTAPVLDHLGRLPVVADLCDAASVRVRDQSRHSRGPRRLLFAWEARQLAAAERKVLARAERVVFASERDRAALDPGAAHACAVVPNGVDLHYWDRTTTALAPDSIVFTGAMSYPPNEDAALRLLALLPQVRAAIPRASLDVVGRSPSSRLVRAAAKTGATVTGTVPDVRPYLERATVFAAPLRFGAGIQNKVLEALAMRIPVVTTNCVAAGLATQAAGAAPVTIADSDADVVAALVTALRHGRANPATHDGGRAFVERWFSWGAAGAALHTVCTEAMGGANAWSHAGK